jgi:hypothetical protein
MNDLIDQMFGDPYITIDCEGGECLHYSQVPGYVVSSPCTYVILPNLSPATPETRQHKVDCAERRWGWVDRYHHFGRCVTADIDNLYT